MGGRLGAPPRVRGGEAGSGARGRRGLALTSGKAPWAKTISSDVFPQPPSPTRTTLTDRAPDGASAPSAWAALIARGRLGGGSAGRNVEGAGRREEVRAAGGGVRGQVRARGPASGPAGQSVRVPLGHSGDPSRAPTECGRRGHARGSHTRPASSGGHRVRWGDDREPDDDSVTVCRGRVDRERGGPGPLPLGRRRRWGSARGACQLCRDKNWGPGAQHRWALKKPVTLDE